MMVDEYLKNTSEYAKSLITKSHVSLLIKLIHQKIVDLLKLLLDCAEKRQEEPDVYFF